MKRLITIFVLSLFLIDSGSVDTEVAEAGVLSRGNNQINIRVPKIRNRNVKASTAAMRRTQPPIEYRDTPVVEQYQRMARTDYKYQRKLYKWEKKRIRLEQRAARKAERTARREQRKREKEAKALAKKSGANRQPGGKADPSVAHDPTSWFSQKIAQQRPERPAAVREPAGSGKRLLSSNEQPEQDAKGRELDVTPKKKSSFWTHVFRALGLS